MKKIIWILIILALAIRLLGVNHVLFGDETIWGYATYQDYPHVIGTEEAEHPPLFLLVLKTSTAVLTFQTFALRLIPLIFGILSLYLTYSLAKKQY